MDPRRLRAGEVIAALSGVALFVSLFLPWYETGGESVTGWEALAVNDVILATIALCAVSLVPVVASQRAPAIPIAAESLCVLGGMLATILVLVRVMWLPDLADQREWALWLALAGALGVTVGSLIAIRDERLSKPGRPTDSSGAPIEHQPEVELMPAPRP